MVCPFLVWLNVLGAAAMTQETLKLGLVESKSIQQVFLFLLHKHGLMMTDESGQCLPYGVF